VLADPVTLEDKKVLDRSFSTPSYNWSPDSRWIVLSKDDNDFNTDVWIYDTTGVEAPYNVSRHPDEDTSPAMDGKGRFDRVHHEGWPSERHGSDDRVAAEGRRRENSRRIGTMKLRRRPVARLPLRPRPAPLPGATPPGSARRPGSRRPGRRPRPSPSRGRRQARADAGSASGCGGRIAPWASRATSRPDKKVDPVVIEFKGLHKRTKKVVSGEGRRASPAPSPDGKLDDRVRSAGNPAVVV
jgi:tricorn protease